MNLTEQINTGYQTVNCPFCIERGKPTPDTKKHLYVYGEGRGVHCFRCDFNRARVVPDIVKDLLIGDEYLQVSNDPDEKLPDFFAKDNPEWWVRFARPVVNYSRPMKYLTGRGMSDDEIEKFGLLYETSGQFQGRIIFPIREGNDGPIRYFVGRSISKKHKPKYLNCPTGKNGYVYIVGNGDNGIVSEGPMDAIAAARAGYRGIALLGKSINAAQCKTIKNTGVRAVTVVLDPDAFMKSIDVARELSYYVDTRRKDLRSGVDLGDLKPETIRSIIETDLGSVTSDILGVENDERSNNKARRIRKNRGQRRTS